ncbi:hypothetical protein [Flagellimonas algicola]|uniref:Lipocalin-like protein n=1 Tax=Flagellimonas algicola TaxID=2583815 RepID=A0ABY2WFW3_9FLAO|nr:hypothetical protein [Allomuricauda algicola]TMU50424.1 hypothetical protein FGG15_19570 [Allomuricauda algicola]
MNKTRIVICIIAVTGIFYSCNEEKQRPTYMKSIESGWKLVYQNDENGSRLTGNIDSLIVGIRNGYDIRVGWGWEEELADSVLRLEHMAEPVFLSIIQEKSVSVVIDGHPLLQSYIDADNQKIGEGGHIWQCVLTTSGTFSAQVHNRSTGELIKDWPQRHKMTWFLEYPNYKQKKNKPLF